MTTPQTPVQLPPLPDEREAILRAAVAAMPHTNPLVADDLIEGHTMHTEADDIVAIWQAATRAALEAQKAGQEPLSSDKFWTIIKDIHAAVIKQLPRHPCPSVMQARASACPANIIVNIESLGDYLREAQKAAAPAKMLVPLSEGQIEAARKATGHWSMVSTTPFAREIEALIATHNGLTLGAGGAAS